jgi:hypothetical protein
LSIFSILAGARGRGEKILCCLLAADCSQSPAVKAGDRNGPGTNECWEMEFFIHFTITDPEAASYKIQQDTWCPVHVHLFSETKWAIESGCVGFVNYEL